MALRAKMSNCSLKLAECNEGLNLSTNCVLSGALGNVPDFDVKCQTASLTPMETDTTTSAATAISTGQLADYGSRF